MRCRLDAFVLEATTPQLQADFDAGRYSAIDLVAYYVDRIRRLDAIQLRSVIELNPDALEIAAELDGERSAGRGRGPLHGVPILLKDNIGTGDRLHTTAGAAALSTARSDRDAHLVSRVARGGRDHPGQDEPFRVGVLDGVRRAERVQRPGRSSSEPVRSRDRPIWFIHRIGGGCDHESGGDHRRHRDRGINSGAFGQSIGRRHAAFAGAGEPRPGRSYQ